MTSSLDRQGILDNLTTIETTAKLLVNALVKKNSDAELYITGIHREELLTQTTTFLAEAKQLILNLSSTFNLTIDEYFQKKPIKVNGKLLTTSSASNRLQNNGDRRADVKKPPSNRIYSLSSVTLDDIIDDRLIPRNLFPNYPLLCDAFYPNLVSLARSLRQLDDRAELILKAYLRIFTPDERIYCNYQGIRGKLPLPRQKRQLFDLFVRLILDEQQKTLDDDERENFYNQCENHFATDMPTLEYPGVNIDHLNNQKNGNDERRFVCALFRLVLLPDDICRIAAAKQDLPAPWNDNEVCIYYARPAYLAWIKRQWLKRYPTSSDNEAQRWAQCIDWAMDSFPEAKKVRPSKRKTMDGSTDHKRTKTPLTFQEKLQQIDRTKFNVFEYGAELLRLISEENYKALPTLEQLKLLESNLVRFYWTPDQQKTWSRVVDTINDVFGNEAYDGQFRQFYSKKLLATNEESQMEIERLLQITE